MDPARPRTQPFIARVVKAVPSNRQNTERSEEQRPIATITMGAPGEAHVTGEKHSDKHRNRHRGGAVDFHGPRFSAHLEITR